MFEYFKIIFEINSILSSNNLLENKYIQLSLTTLA